MPGTDDETNQVLDSIWSRIQELGLASLTWYDGAVQTREDFKNTFRSINVLPVLVWDTVEQKLKALAWLSGLYNRHAVVHFCSLDTYRRGVGECVIDYWRGFKNDDGGPLFVLLLGVTPENNKRALKLSRMLGFQQRETIPKLCWLHYEQRFVGGVVSHLVMED